MENQGICPQCRHDKQCSFPRRFPIISCEKFATQEAKKIKTNLRNKKSYNTMAVVLNP